MLALSSLLLASVSFSACPKYRLESWVYHKAEQTLERLGRAPSSFASCEKPFQDTTTESIFKLVSKDGREIYSTKVALVLTEHYDQLVKGSQTQLTGGMKAAQDVYFTVNLPEKSGASRARVSVAMNGATEEAEGKY